MKGVLHKRADRWRESPSFWGNPQGVVWRPSDEREPCVDELSDSRHADFVRVTEISHAAEGVPPVPVTGFLVEIEERVGDGVPSADRMSALHRSLRRHAVESDLTRMTSLLGVLASRPCSISSARRGANCSFLVTNVRTRRDLYSQPTHLIAASFSRAFGSHPLSYKSTSAPRERPIDFGKGCPTKRASGEHSRCDRDPPD